MCTSHRPASRVSHSPTSAGENAPAPPVTTNTQRPFTGSHTSIPKKANPISPPAAASGSSYSMTSDSSSVGGLISTSTRRTALSVSTCVNTTSTNRAHRSCGRHMTWRCECGAVTYGPALADGCSVLDGPARVRSRGSGKAPARCKAIGLQQWDRFTVGGPLDHHAREEFENRTSS
jgi:hypothetical protein